MMMWNGNFARRRGSFEANQEAGMGPQSPSEDSGTATVTADGPTTGTAPDRPPRASRPRPAGRTQ
ncbi:MAG: hypothetical protein JWL99_2342 [Streptomyces oryziradicis]|jgi:hypothetical protein|nr:hypothetical protein [Actinacidiphila oryziradicis]